MKKAALGRLISKADAVLGAISMGMESALVFAFAASLDGKADPLRPKRP